MRGAMLALVSVAALSTVGADHLVGSASLAAKLKEHPIKGVITMLEELENTAKDEGAAEAGDYAKYSDWCKESQSSLNDAIATEKGAIASLTDELNSLNDQIATLEADIDYLSKQIQKQNNEAAAAQQARDDRHNLYDGEQTNYEATIEAVEEATDGLEQAEPELLQGNSKAGFLQTATGAKLKEKVRVAGLYTEFRMSDKQHSSVKRFLDDPVEDHSHEAVETFQNMEEDFKVDKDASTEDENHAKNEFNLAKQAREAAIQAAEDAKEEKEGILNDKKGRKGDAEGEKTEQEDALVADSATLDTTKQDCSTTAQQFKERTEIRTNEIEAMQIAVKILEKVTKVRNPDEHEIPAKAASLLQKPRFDYGGADDTMGMFVQVGAVHNDHHQSKHALLESALKIVRHAANETHAVHTAALSQLAAQLETYDGPFDSIKAMMQKMIFHLIDEQKDEDNHKNWCDLEVEKSTEEKEDKDEKQKTLTKKIEELDTEIKELIQKISDNEEKTANLNEHMQEETKLRTDNHKEIEATIKDAADAQKALAEATEVLTKFYKDSGAIVKEPWEFIQASAKSSNVVLPDKPSTWDAGYTGVSDPKNGDNAILALLGKTNEKFAEMESTAKVQDVTDQKNFESDMQASKIEISETAMDTSMKTERRTTTEEKVEGMREAKGHMAIELNAVNSYLKDLEPACGSGDSSYEDRKQARTDEIEALRKAQTILEDAFRESDE